jgi:hypothetical protein
LDLHFSRTCFLPIIKLGSKALKFLKDRPDLIRSMGRDAYSSGFNSLRQLRHLEPMRMWIKFGYLFPAIISLLFVSIGCNRVGRTGTQPATVDLSLKNNSNKDLDWVELQWSGPDVPGGILSPGISKTAIGVQWPYLPAAKLTFIDGKTRQPYTIDVQFTAANDQIRQGNCRNVTLRILDYDKADVVCDNN